MNEALHVHALDLATGARASMTVTVDAHNVAWEDSARLVMEAELSADADAAAAARIRAHLQRLREGGSDGAEPGDTLVIEQGAVETVPEPAPAGRLLSTEPPGAETDGVAIGAQEEL